MSAPHGVWLVAGTSMFQPYPCRCVPRGPDRQVRVPVITVPPGLAPVEFRIVTAPGDIRCSPVWCPCAGRLDVWNFAAGCCAWVHTPAVAAAAQRAYAASRGW